MASPGSDVLLLSLGGFCRGGGDLEHLADLDLLGIRDPVSLHELILGDLEFFGDFPRVVPFDHVVVGGGIGFACRCNLNRRRWSRCSCRLVGGRDSGGFLGSLCGCSGGHRDLQDLTDLKMQD